MDMVNHLRRFPLLFKGRGVVETEVQTNLDLEIIDISIDEELTLDLYDIHKLHINSKSALLELEFKDIEKAHFQLIGQFRSIVGGIQPSFQEKKEKNTQYINIQFSTMLKPIHCQLILKVSLPLSFGNCMTIESTSGGIIAKGGNLVSLNLSTVSGALNIKNFVGDKLIANTISGNINISNSKGSLELASTSGNMIIDTTSCVNKIRINTTSGNSVINLPYESDYALDSKTSTGKLIHPSDVGLNTNQTHHYNKEEIFLRSVSGDFELIKEQKYFVR